MKRFICFLGLIVLTAGCGFSLKESMIRNERPDFLKTYSGRPISLLSQKDIDEAIEFGKNNKHNQNVINYAFMVAKDSSRLTEIYPRTIYVLICTNYYLIADYAATQERNYESIDMGYVNFLAHLPAFKIEVMEQINNLYYPLQADSKFVLLRDGQSIKESQDNSMYKDTNPYTIAHLGIQSSWQEEINEAMKKNVEMANKMAEAYQKNTKIDFKNVMQVPTAPKHLYDYKDIDLKSRYEVVVIYSDREIHIPIEFSNIK